jgi:ribonucleoside-diphosphate reductase beta chain|tara:strand:+ start:24138 stop:25214 length:1077 start_codon:yes stop_codon:yes gene_type:complete
MQTIFNTVNVDTTTQPLFLGEGLSIQRYDKHKYEIFFKLFRDQLEFFWTPEEISILKDRNDFKNMTDNEQFIFLSNLRFQTLLDSMIGRGINEILRHVSNPELEACMNVWNAFENVHSYSYTHIIKNVFADPSEVFDSILEDKEIVIRANSVAATYDELMNLDDATEDEIKQKLFDAIIATNILESIRFYVSFACSFFFGSQKKMTGNANIIKQIARDENLHVAITQNIVKFLRTREDEGFQDIVKNSEERVVEMFRVAAEEEKDWVDYLFSKGPIVGLTDRELKGYVEWLTNSRLKSLGYTTKIYPDAKKNPIDGWLRFWYDSESIQSAPQEEEITAYRIGAANTELSPDSFSEMEL